MRKIIVSEMISVDGFFSDAKSEIGWHVVEEEFNRYAIELLSSVDTILFGRVTFQMFESYWPDELKNQELLKGDHDIAGLIDVAKKIVFSKTLVKSDWKNTVFMSDIRPDEINAWKQQPGKDMVVYGSGTVVSRLAELGLIDEYRFFIAPVALGNGKTLFSGIKDNLALRLTDEKRFSSGVAVLIYQPQ